MQSVQTLADERIDKIAAERGDEIFSYSSTPPDQHVFRVRRRKIDSNAPKEARTHTVGSDVHTSWSAGVKQR